MAREITKTGQIGVRFNKDLLEGVVSAGIADSPQKALNLYESSYLELIELKVKINNKPENKERIENDRKGVNIETENKTESEPPKKMSMKERIALEEANYFKSKNQ